MNRELNIIRADRVRPSLLRPSQPDGWGPWHLDQRVEALCCHNEHGEDRYVIHLDRFVAPDAALNTIGQVAHKRWADDRALAGLVRALDDTLGLQAWLINPNRSVAEIGPLVQRTIFRPEVICENPL